MNADLSTKEGRLNLACWNFLRDLAQHQILAVKLTQDATIEELAQFVRAQAALIREGQEP